MTGGRRGGDRDDEAPDLPGLPGGDGPPEIVDVTDGRLAALRAGVNAGFGPIGRVPAARVSPDPGPPASGSPGLVATSGPLLVGPHAVPGGHAVPEGNALPASAGPGAPGPAGPDPAGLSVVGLEAPPAGWPRPHRRALVAGRVLAVVADGVALGVGWTTSVLVPDPQWRIAMPGASGAAGLAVVIPLWCGLVAAGRGYAPGTGVRARADAAARFAALTCLFTLLVHPAAARGLVIVVPVALVTALVLRAGVGGLTVTPWGRPVRVLVVGRPEAVRRVGRRLVARGGRGVRVVGSCLTAEVPEDDGDLLAVRTDDVLRRRVTAAARAAGADAVLLADTASFPALSQRRLAWALHSGGIGLLLAAGPDGVSAGRLRVRPFGDVPVLRVEPPAFTGGRRAVKELIDRFGAGTLLVVLAPLLIGIAAAVRLSGPGPVIFRQVRVGRHGERFVMLKFRSMCADAPVRRAELEHLNDHAAGGVLFKLRSDPRVTAVGQVLRRLSLDELPQLVNVLRGEMSLVGPRPALPSEVERYQPDVLRRLLVKPGLTGLWQVSGRADLDWAESVRLDLGYVENWSLRLDLDILCRTARAVLLGHGAR